MIKLLTLIVLASFFNITIASAIVSARILPQSDTTAEERAILQKRKKDLDDQLALHAARNNAESYFNCLTDMLNKSYKDPKIKDKNGMSAMLTGISDAKSSLNNSDAVTQIVAKLTSSYNFNAIGIEARNSLPSGTLSSTKCKK